MIQCDWGELDAFDLIANGDNGSTDGIFDKCWKFWHFRYIDMIWYMRWYESGFRLELDWIEIGTDGGDDGDDDKCEMVLNWINLVDQTETMVIKTSLQKTNFEWIWNGKVVN